MRYGKLFCFLGLSAIAILGSSLTAESARSEELVIKQSTSELSNANESSNGQGGCQKIDKSKPLQSKRIELFHYRNSVNLVNLLNGLLSKEIGCAQVLAENSLEAGIGVGRGGGNIILLYGTQDYINRAHRVIAPLDLRLPGLDLQLWGVQISSGNPDKLAKVMTDVRSKINLTQQLVRDTFGLFQLEAQSTLADPKLLEPDFMKIVESLGYGSAFSVPRRLSLLDIFLVGKVVKEPTKYYRRLYNSVVQGEIENGRFKASDERYQEYFDTMRDTGRPPFERLFRSQGLKPKCKHKNPNDDNCEMWDWEKIKEKSAMITVHANRTTILEFAFQYADFTSNPNQFNAEELQRTSGNLNSVLQQFTSFFQKDIEDLFVRPTLTDIQKRVARSRKVSFAQVGRTTIATLSGVRTEINSSSISAFEIPQYPTFEELLTRAEQIEKQVDKFIPLVPVPLPAGEDSTTPKGSTNSTIPIVNAGPLPISRLIGLTVALTDQQFKPIQVKTGTNLTFTPGVLSDLNSAELNIHLTVIDPVFTPTQEEDVLKISRVGEQEVKTTVYTQALDFFDLSTFTSQATLDGGRGFFPIVGQLWHAIFGSIPGLGKLFSFPRGSQNVLHESLLLTNSFITPTSLGLGLIYPIDNQLRYQGKEFCNTKIELLNYLYKLNLPKKDRGLVFRSLLSDEDQKRCEIN